MERGQRPLLEAKSTRFYIKHLPGEKPSRFYIKNSATQESATKKPTRFYIKHLPGERPPKFYIKGLPEQVLFSLPAKKKKEEDEKQAA
jgi:hypothetical protein